jgi:hypothetical protein
LVIIDPLQQPLGDICRGAYREGRRRRFPRGVHDFLALLLGGALFGRGNALSDTCDHTPRAIE